MSDRDPGRWLDRLVGACFGLMLGAMALWFAVEIVQSIWLWLAGLAAVISLVWLGIWRRTRW